MSRVYRVSQDRIRHMRRFWLFIGATVVCGSVWLALLDPPFEVAVFALVPALLGGGGGCALIAYRPLPKEIRELTVRVEEGVLIWESPKNTQHITLDAVRQLVRWRNASGQTVALMLTSGKKRHRLWGFEQMDDLDDAVVAAFEGSVPPTTERHTRRQSPFMPGAGLVVGLCAGLFLAIGLGIAAWGEDTVLLLLMACLVGALSCLMWLAATGRTEAARPWKDVLSWAIILLGFIAAFLYYWFVCKPAIRQFEERHPTEERRSVEVSLGQPNRNRPAQRE